MRVFNAMLVKRKYNLKKQHIIVGNANTIYIKNVQMSIAKYLLEEAQKMI